MEDEIKYCIKEFETNDDIIIKLKKEVNNLTLTKAALLGFLDSAVDELPKRRRDLYRQKIASYKIKPLGWTDELPYVI